MPELSITKETEEKRLKDFKKIAENWDNIPDYPRGRLDGIISTMASIYGNNGIYINNESEN